uniref:C2H2-type domain-containing protein n=1 Tax=Glossina palpalis gambiensis TaxID=67801 RepID=A0A1B0B090_9MUSC
MSTIFLDELNQKIKSDREDDEYLLSDPIAVVPVPVPVNFPITVNRRTKTTRRRRRDVATRQTSQAVIYTCKFCHRIYAYKGSLARHVRFECEAAPYVRNSFKCNECNYATNRKDNLLLHLRRH